MVVPVPATASLSEVFRVADAAARQMRVPFDGVAQPVAWRLGWDRQACRVASGVLRIVPLPTPESVLAELGERGFTIPDPGPGPDTVYSGRLQVGRLCRSGRHVITTAGVFRSASGRRYCAACRDEANARREARRAGEAS